jgi:hypothetical protein
MLVFYYKLIRIQSWWKLYSDFDQLPHASGSLGWFLLIFYSKSIAMPGAASLK